MIRITPNIGIDEGEITAEFIRASGPGGQNVNKVSTAVKLRFDAAGSSSLPAEVRERLIKLAGRRATEDGTIIIEARRYRTQQRNRTDALDRLITLIRRAAARPKRRRKTKPTVASRQKRLAGKRRRGQIKRLRGPVKPSDQ